MTDFSQAQAYVTALTGSPDTVMEWRVIDDRNKATQARNLTGTLAEQWSNLVQYNQSGWGIFCCINAMNGQGRELSNVQYIRAHVVDFDNPLTSAASYQRAIATHPQPHFAVQSSAGKFHLYWLVEPYTGNEFYTLQQRKLAQTYDGDKSIIDATRVLRVPGFLHQKAEPFLTTCWGIHNGARWTAAQIADSLAHVNLLAHISQRAPLGDPEMQAPSMEWLTFALNLLDPNELDRQEWLSISAAFKQAGWNLADEATLNNEWQKWCARYAKNDAGENAKLWNSVRDTETGWQTFLRRTVVNAYLQFGSDPVKLAQGVTRQAGGNAQASDAQSVGSTPTAPTIDRDSLPEMIDAEQCKVWFKDCYFVVRMGEIFTSNARFLDSTQFNALYGGKQFIINDGGKTTDEPWKAALRSTKWTIPKVDHVRFLPDKPTFAIVEDRMGRKGLNTYVPVKYDARQGDVSLWLQHMTHMLPDENDRNMWLAYMAHCIKFPGHKIPWAPLMQSCEGAGKGFFGHVMKHALGEMYVYQPKAPELVASGSKFNAWMRGKLCIIVDEIKIDERRELIEILKPMITDGVIEIQAKGVDQEMEDNPANWIFFSNYKDAIPIHQNGRRYAVFYSPIQTKQDMDDRGMGDDYFNRLDRWMKQEGGLQAITHWFLNHPIEKGGLPVRAPKTSSHSEALRISRSPMQIIVDESVEDGIQGFRGGYVSSIALSRRVVAAGMKPPSAQSMRAMLEGMGYHEMGRAPTVYNFEHLTDRPIIYGNSGKLTLEGYAQAQGY